MSNIRKSEKFDSHKEGIKIVKVAAFCFAIVSWLATAQGLREYVFNNQYKQALLISFGIQAILFVFNLKLPEYFQQIGDFTSNEKRVYRKYFFGERKGCNKKSFKWTYSQKIIVVFYVVVLLSSSFFSFAYMTNLVYTNTQYIDANITINKTYRKYLNDVDKFIDEYTKVTQLVVCERVSELQNMILENTTGNPSITKNDLEDDVNNAQEEYDNAGIEENEARRTYENAKKIYETPISDTWRSQEEREQERINYEIALANLSTAEGNTKSAEEKLNTAKQALKNYKPDLGTIVRDILTEILKESPEISELEESIDYLNELLINGDKNGIETDEFTHIIVTSKELTIAIENYCMLQTLQSGSEENNTDNIENLKKDLLEKSVIIPTPGTQEFEIQKKNWESLWKERFLSLEKIIESTPYYSDIIKEKDEIDQIIDIELLKRFDGQMLINDIDNTVRKNLYDINILEKVWGFFTGDFPFLARFALLLALFFDLASLLAGLFIYYTPATKKCEK